MAICVEVVPATLVLRQVDPQPATFEACDAVILSGTEYANQQWLSQLTLQDGADIAGAMLLVLAVAWAFRMCIRALNVDTFN